MSSDIPNVTPDLRRIQLCSVLVALVLFAAYQFGRLGTGDTVNMNPLILSIAVLLMPNFLRHFLKQSIAILQVIAIALLFAAGWIAILLHIEVKILVYVMFLISVILFVREIISTSRRIRLAHLILFAFLGLALVYLLWMQDYMNPLAPEAFAAGIRYSHVDTLFHSALTANIRTYAIPSVGLQGLPIMTYHAGSHYLFASFAELCKVDILEFYNYAYPVIFVPLFVQSLFFASYANLKGTNHRLRVAASALVLFFILTGFYSSKFGARYLLPPVTNTHFMSASYNLSLTLMFLAICVYAPFWRRPQVTQPPMNAIIVLCIPLWFFVIGFAKVSTAVVLFAVFVYLILRKRIIFNRWIFTAAVSSAIVLYYVIELTVPNSGNTFDIKWGSFYTVFVSGNIFVYFLLQYLFFAFLVVILVLLMRTSEKHLLNSVVRGKYIVIELIVIAALVGVVPGLLIYIDGGSAYYFSDIQYWLTAIGLMHFSPYLIYKFYSKRVAFKIPFRIAMFVLVVVVTREAIFRSFYYYAKKNVQVRAALVSDSSGVDGKLAVPKNARIFTGLNEAPGYREKRKMLNLELFERLRDLPAQIRSKGVIYCEDPQQLELFLRCSEATFYIPAMSEMAMINGLYWRDSCYTIDAYGIKDYAGMPAELSKEEAKRLARKQGFELMIVINLGKGTYAEVNL